MEDAQVIGGKRRVLYAVVEGHALHHWGWWNENAAKTFLAILCLMGVAEPHKAHTLIERIGQRLLHVPGMTPAEIRSEAMVLRVMCGDGTLANPWLVRGEIDPADLVGMAATPHADMVNAAIQDRTVLKSDRTEINLNNWL